MRESCALATQTGHSRAEALRAARLSLPAGHPALGSPAVQAYFRQQGRLERSILAGSWSTSWRSAET